MRRRRATLSAAASAAVALVEVLQDTALIGPDLRWTGGATHLVSLGDLLDRGTQARRVLDLVMRLQGEALAAGGASTCCSAITSS